MNINKNWEGFTDLSHSNWTLKFPRTSKYDGMGGFEKDSSRIPLSAWIGAAAVVAVFFGFAYIGVVFG